MVKGQFSHVPLVTGPQVCPRSQPSSQIFPITPDWESMPWPPGSHRLWCLTSVRHILQQPGFWLHHVPVAEEDQPPKVALVIPLHVLNDVVTTQRAAVLVLNSPDPNVPTHGQKGHLNVQQRCGQNTSSVKKYKNFQPLPFGHAHRFPAPRFRAVTTPKDLPFLLKYFLWAFEDIPKGLIYLLEKPTELIKYSPKHQWNVVGSPQEKYCFSTVVLKRTSISRTMKTRGNPQGIWKQNQGKSNHSKSGKISTFPQCFLLFFPWVF